MITKGELRGALIICGLTLFFAAVGARDSRMMGLAFLCGFAIWGLSHES